MALPLRIFRSFNANYYLDDILRGPEAYPEEYFDTLVENGFNAVWLRGILRNLAATDVFPTLGKEIARHQDALGTVVERAQRRGVQVLLYLNEPLCLPTDHSFWKEHPEVMGVREESSMDEWYDTRGFCTSTPEVRAWLREASARLFRDIPGLGGWFCITASEHHTNCYCHTQLGKETACPRCAARQPYEVVADLINDLHDGTRESSPTAHCIAWNWSWAWHIEADPQPELLRRLPRDMRILLDWERGSQRTMPNGKTNWVDEYSLSFVGPSERFLTSCREARAQGLAVMGKLQVGTTHELATVPNLPLVDHLYEKLAGCEAQGLSGVLATWNFGNAFSLNTAAVARFTWQTDRPSTPEFVRGLAADYFPGANAAGVAAAVAQLSTAMAWFPFDIPFIYFGPCNFALGYPLTLDPLQGTPIGRSWVMDTRGDDLQQSLDQFTLDEVIELLGTTAAEWGKGVAMLEAALAGCTHPHAAQELGVARVAGSSFRSARNVYRTYKLRLERPADMDAQFAVIVEDEIATLEEALPCIEADGRLGFHAECQGYMYSAEVVRGKLTALRECGGVKVD